MHEMPNKMTAEDFKAKLMAAIIEFSFNGNGGNEHLGRIVYNAVDAAFRQYDKLLSENAVPLSANGNGAAPVENEKPKKRFRPEDPNSMLSQVRNRLDDMKK